MSMVPDDVCEFCGAPLDALGNCTGSCDPADRADDVPEREDEW